MGLHFRGLYVTEAAYWNCPRWPTPQADRMPTDCPARNHHSLWSIAPTAGEEEVLVKNFLSESPGERSPKTSTMDGPAGHPICIFYCLTLEHPLPIWPFPPGLCVYITSSMGPNLTTQEPRIHSNISTPHPNSLPHSPLQCYHCALQHFTFCIYQFIVHNLFTPLAGWHIHEGLDLGPSSSLLSPQYHT